jgi:hypothetical protein
LIQVMGIKVEKADFNLNQQSSAAAERQGLLG